MTILLNCNCWHCLWYVTCCKMWCTVYLCNKMSYMCSWKYAHLASIFVAFYFSMSHCSQCSCCVPLWHYFNVCHSHWCS